MADIEETRFATSDPLDLCKGKYLWPGVGVSLGFTSSGEAGPIIRSTPQILAWKFSVGVSYEFFMGVCGPSYAMGMTLSGTEDNGALNLAVADDELQAGLVMGFFFTAKANLELEQSVLHWVGHGCHAHLESEWVGKFSADVGVTFDVIGFFWSVISAIMESQDGELKEFPNKKGYWGAFASTRQAYGYGDSVVAEPKMRFPINIVPDVPELEAINVGLHALLGELSMGPDIWIGVPVTTSIAKITLDGSNYTNVHAAGGGKLTASGPALSGAPSKMTIDLNHDAGFDFGVGLYAEVSVLKIFSLSGNLDISLLHLFGITVHGTTYTDTYSADVGGSSASRECDCGLAGAAVTVSLEPATA